MLEPFDTASLTPMPWKNGGGSTLELARSPEDAGLNDFDWRISIATVAASGLFSIFPGVDRTIVLLSGEGMDLRSARGEIDHALVAAGVPFSFPGDIAIDARLRKGISRDFNVMLRRPLRAETLVLRDTASVRLGGCGLLYVNEGAWSIDGATIGRGQGLRWGDEPGSLHAARLSSDGMLVVVHIG